MQEDEVIETMTTGQDIFQAYAQELSGIGRSAHKDQAELHKRAYSVNAIQDSVIVEVQDPRAMQRLWAEASKIVLYVHAKMKRSGKLPTVSYNDLDAIQEANLAVGMALPRWEPDRGTLATWLVPTIRGTLLNYANTHLNAGIGSKHVNVVRIGLDEQVDSEEISSAQDEPGMEQSMGITREELLTYPDDTIPSPPDAAARTELQEAIGTLPMPLYDYAVGHWLEGVSVADIAYSAGVSGETVRRALRQAHDYLKLVLVYNLKPVENGRQTGT